MARNDDEPVFSIEEEEEKAQKKRDGCTGQLRRIGCGCSVILGSVVVILTIAFFSGPPPPAGREAPRHGGIAPPPLAPAPFAIPNGYEITDVDKSAPGMVVYLLSATGMNKPENSARISTTFCVAFAPDVPENRLRSIMLRIGYRADYGEPKNGRTTELPVGDRMVEMEEWTHYGSGKNYNLHHYLVVVGKGVIATAISKRDMIDRQDFALLIDGLQKDIEKQQSTPKDTSNGR